jgi:chromosome segregation protein
MIDLLRRTAELHNEIHSLCIRREGLHGQRDRLARRAEEIHLALENLLAERAGVQVKLGEVESVLSDAHGRLDETRQEGLKLQGAQESLAERLNQARERRSAVGSRIQALSEMQQRLEGVSSGVRLVLDACRDGRLRGIRGILGQFIQTDVEHAAVVEAALAGADQRLLADRLADIETAVGQFNEVLGENGAVEVLCMDRLGAFSQDLSLADCPRAIARVIDWVRFEAWLSPVVWRLLGRTLVTRTLSDAAAAARIVGGDFRFVTLSGEVLETDGRVRLGAARSGAGMIARRSELVDLESHQQQLESQINHLQQQQAESGAQREHLDRLEQKLRTVVYEATTERVECHSRIRQLDEQVGKLEQEKPLIAADRRAMAADIEAAMQAEQQAQQRAAELARRSADCQVEVERLSGQLKEAFQSRDQRTATMTELKVALGRAEEKERSIRESLAALTEQHRQMERDLLAGRSEIELARQRRGEAEAGIGAAAQEIESLYNQQQQLNSQAEELQETQRGVTERLEETVRQLSEQRKVREASANEVNGLRVQLGEADVRIENLIARAADEMGMGIPELYRTYRHDDARDWDAVAGQIKELRDKIERLGNINLDAIAEQDELQKRKDFLTAQLEDVRSSQNQLNELIRRINRESRQLFIETFEAVRGNFQELFRKLFGGGRADILLIDPEDVLESGIEIVARPPGKELRTLSLLSGGEKTMTALALLFSIFRARPSPFCLLDEVDAALDEPNTERFARLLQEFNQHSQFIIISHAKRTMSMASVLYGVTMQEPGVSKRISVRFEEVDRHLNKQEQPVGA